VWNDKLLDEFFGGLETQGIAGALRMAKNKFSRRNNFLSKRRTGLGEVFCKSKSCGEGWC